MKQLSVIFSLLKGTVACLLAALIMVLWIASASASALDDDLGPNRDAFLQAALCAGFAMSVDDREVAYAVISLMKVFAPDSVRAMGRADSVRPGLKKPGCGYELLQLGKFFI